MNYFNNLTTNIPRIFSYNKKNHLSLNIKKKNNKAEENKISLTQLHQSKNLSINESLSRLREYIKTPKPYVILMPMKIKMKYIKMAKKKAIEKFHSSTVKSTSARIKQNNYSKKLFENVCLSERINQQKNNNKRLTLKIDDIFTCKKRKKLRYKSQISNKINLSKKIKSNISNIKTNFSSSQNDEFSLFSLKNKTIFAYNEIYDKYDLLGYKNYFVKAPLCTENGIIKDFMDKVNDLRKDNYKNYYLKLNEFKTNILYENKLSQIEFNKRKHTLTKYYLDKYNNSFNIYWYKIKRELKKESESIDNLNYKIKEVKMDINKLSTKIQKRIIKIIDISIVRDFFKEIKQFSSFKIGTPYYKLLEYKNEIMKNLRDHEEQTNFIRYLLNDKELGIHSFIEKNEDIFNNKNIKQIIISQIKEIKDIPGILNMNIKNLLMEEHDLEKEIDLLKYKLSDMLKNSKENNYYEKLTIIEYNNCIKKLSRIKTEHEYLKYKNEKLKNNNQIHTFGNLGKNIRIKILQIIKTLNTNKYITEEENNVLHELFWKNKMNYFVRCMLIIEKKINILNKFKEEVINTNEEYKNIYKYSCIVEDAKRKKLKELEEKNIREQNIINKLNKTKYLNDKKKDFFFVNRILYIKNKEKSEKKQQKQTAHEKDDIDPSFKKIFRLI